MIVYKELDDDARGSLYCDTAMLSMSTLLCGVALALTVLAQGALGVNSFAGANVRFILFFVCKY